MQTDTRAALLGQQPETDTLHRIDAQLQALNARIARLAIALRAPLETEADVQRVLERRPVAVAVERRSGNNAGASYDGPERRVAHKWDELRGLLLLRYGLCTRLAQTVGAESLRHLLAAANGQMQREGFTDGSDGIPSRSLSA